MNPEQTDGAQTPGSAPRARRRVAPGDTGGDRGRSGCLLTGAILGVIVGATFAFYGLPPILRHFYGERHIAGQVYEGDAKTVGITYVGNEPDPAVGALDAFTGSWGGSELPGVYVTLKVLTNKTWNPKLNDFSLQFSGVDDWTPADASAGVESIDGQLHFPLTVELIVTFHFPRPIEAGAGPRYLHLIDPLIRLELPLQQ